MSTAKPKKAAPAAAAPVGAAVAAGQKALDSAVKAGTEGVEKAFAMTEEGMEKACSAAVQSFDDWKALGQENVEAMITAGTVFSDGAEKLGAELVSYSRDSLKSNVSMTKALIGCRNLMEMVELQTSYAKDSFDSLVAESRKLTDMGLAVANDMAAPLNACASKAAKKMLQPLAA